MTSRERRTFVTVGLLILAWAASAESLQHDAECTVDPAAARKLAGQATDARRNLKHVIGAALHLAGQPTT